MSTTRTHNVEPDMLAAGLYDRSLDAPSLLNQLIDSGIARELRQNMQRRLALRFFPHVTLTRLFEQTTAERYAHGRIAGFLHLYSGEEAETAFFDLEWM